METSRFEVDNQKLEKQTKPVYKRFYDKICQARVSLTSKLKPNKQSNNSEYQSSVDSSEIIENQPIPEKSPNSKNFADRVNQLRELAVKALPAGAVAGFASITPHGSLVVDKLAELKERFQSNPDQVISELTANIEGGLEGLSIISRWQSR